MNFKELKTKILLENFVKYCKKNNIKARDIENVEKTWNEQYYLREFIGDLIRKGTEKLAGYGYQKGLNAISTKVQKLMDELNKSSTDIGQIIQTYKIDTEEANVKGILQALENLKTPYANLQNKLSTIAGTVSKGLRGGPVEAGEEEVANQPLIDSIAKEIQTQFDTSFPSGGTPQAEQNRKLLSPLVQKYLKALNPEQYETAKKNIIKQIQRSAGNDVKAYALLNNISKLAGGTGDASKDFGREEVKTAKISPAILNKWVADTGRYVNTLTTINQAIRDDFIKAYRDILKNSDPSKIAEMNKSIAREIKKIATSTVIDKQKEMDIASLTAKLRNKKVV